MQKSILPYSDGQISSIDTLILHCIAFEAEGAIQRFHQRQVSPHYMVGGNGAIYQLVDEKNKARHAGRSTWRGKSELNNNSIGIEVCHMTLGQTPYDQRQVHALIWLCQKIIRKYHIKPQNVIGHSDVAPRRRSDPGKSFPWQYLARHGIGLWYNLNDAKYVDNDNPTELLAAIGYDVTNLQAATVAFCRHFMPDFIGTEKDVAYLAENPDVDNFKIEPDVLLPVLKAVAWKYNGQHAERNNRSNMINL